MKLKSLWTEKQREEIDKEFQHRKGCLKSIFPEGSYILCGDATYWSGTRVFCRSCRIKFLQEELKAEEKEDES